MSWLSFDCYGTLIDWERGILDALKPLHTSTPDAELLRRYGDVEAALEARPYRPYRDILQDAAAGFGMSSRFALEDWAPFPDTAEALRRLGRRYKLAILSNVDDELFAASARKLGVVFDAIVTAQQCRSYKPSLNNFLLLRERLGEPPLHCAQSLFHDHGPAKRLGWRTAWVKRGAVIGAAAEARPDVVVDDLRGLADALGA
jgi:2-haloacid dehalogenase